MYNYYGRIYRNKTFEQIFPSFDVFRMDYENSSLTTDGFEDTSLEKLYYLLYAKYGSSHIASQNENQFKYKLYSIIFSQGMIWQKSLEVQKRLQELSYDEIQTTHTLLRSHAYNPAEGGTTVDSGTQVLDYINEQDSTKYDSSKVNSYFNYMMSLKDVTTDFIDQFSSLFLKVVQPEAALLYEMNEEDDDL